MTIKKIISISCSLVLFTIVLTCETPLVAADIEMAQTGDFNNTNTWVGGVIPTSSDNIVINNNNYVLTISANTTIIDLTANNQFTLVINSSITFTSAAIVANNNFTVSDNGTLNATSFLAKNNADVDIQGIANINGNFTINGGGTNSFNVDGELNVSETLDLNGVDIDGTGVVIAGTCANIGSGSNVPCDEALPIVLGGFTLEVQENNVELDWETISEENFDFFSVERSEDGVGFYELGTVPGNGNSKKRVRYSFVDKNPLFGISYYRLTATDYDGSWEKFKILPVEYFPEDIQVSIYPNPGNGRNFTVRLGLHSESKLRSVSVFSQDGRKVFESSLNPGKTDLNLQYNIQKGLYFVEIQIDNYHTSQKLLVD